MGDLMGLESPALFTDRWPDSPSSALPSSLRRPLQTFFLWP